MLGFAMAWVYVVLVIVNIVLVLGSEVGVLVTCKVIIHGAWGLV